MGKLFKNLKPYWSSVLLILVLLVVQAFCDLSLPQYTSDIIDTGIQNSGVEHILPEQITAEEFENAQLFMTESEKQKWQNAYDGEQRKESLSGKDLDELDSDLLVPVLLNYQMSMMSEDSFREMLAQQQTDPNAAAQMEQMTVEELGRRTAPVPADRGGQRRQLVHSDLCRCPPRVCGNAAERTAE